MRYATSVLFCLAAVAAAQVRPDVPVLKAGVSVRMAATSHAVPVPAADLEGAQVVAVTSNGAVYFGVTRVGSEQLAQRLKGTARPVFLKADARLAWSGVAGVLDTIRGAGLPSATLLTDQPAKPGPARIMPPMGIAVNLGPAPAGVPVVEAPCAAAPAHAVAVKPAASATFADAVRTLDACHAPGAGPYLVTPHSPAR